MFGPSFRQKIPQVIVFALVLIGTTLFGVETIRDRPNAIIEVVADNLVFRGNNPTIFAEPGSKVKLIFRNESNGIEHDLAIEGLDVETGILRPGDREEITFSTPPRDTVLTYYCVLHPMMKGKFVVGNPSSISLSR